MQSLGLGHIHLFNGLYTLHVAITNITVIGYTTYNWTGCDRMMEKKEEEIPSHVIPKH